MGTIIASPPGEILAIALMIQISSLEPTVGPAQFTTRMTVKLPLGFHSRLVLVGSSSTNQLATSKKSNRGLVISLALVASAMIVLVRYVVVGVVVVVAGVDLVEYLVVVIVVLSKH